MCGILILLEGPIGVSFEQWQKGKMCIANVLFSWFIDRMFLTKRSLVWEPQETLFSDLFINSVWCSSPRPAWIPSHPNPLIAARCYICPRHVIPIDGLKKSSWTDYKSPAGRKLPWDQNAPMGPIFEDVVFQCHAKQIVCPTIYQQRQP